MLNKNNIKNTNITPFLYSNFLSFLMHFNQTPQEKNSLNQKTNPVSE